MDISIAMATYNGDRFIKEQIESILGDITPTDEIVISDDGSSDETLNIISEYQSKYPNIILLKGPHKGVFKNFENALLACNKEVICLSDQDDIWLKGKRDKILAIFGNKNVSLILHNATMFDENGDYLCHYVKKRDGVIMNIIKNCYWGCCMAFKKDFIFRYIPFGFSGVAHDQLIGLLGEKEKCSYFLDEVLTRHRVHGRNVSTPQTIINKIKVRIHLAWDFQRALKRGKK